MTARTTATKAKTSRGAPEPIRLKKRPKDQPREVIFEIESDGDVAEYTAPVTVGFGYSLAMRIDLDAQPDEYLRELYLVRELCGPEALAAVLSDTTMTGEDWKGLIARLQTKALGPTERGDGEGN